MYWRPVSNIRSGNLSKKHSPMLVGTSNGAAQAQTKKASTHVRGRC